MAIAKIIRCFPECKSGEAADPLLVHYFACAPAGNSVLPTIATDYLVGFFRSNADAGDPVVAKSSVRDRRKSTMSSSSSLVSPRLPITLVRFADVSGAGQQLTFSPGDPWAQRGSDWDVL